MPETKWGRKETIIWPPRKPIYTLGALFLSVIATGLFVYLRFTFAHDAARKILPSALPENEDHRLRSCHGSVSDALHFRRKEEVSPGDRSGCGTRQYSSGCRQSAALEGLCRRGETGLDLSLSRPSTGLPEQASPYLSETGCIRK